MRYLRVFGVTLATALLMGIAMVSVATADHPLTLTIGVAPASPTTEGTELTISGQASGHNQVESGEVDVRRYTSSADCAADTYPPGPEGTHVDTDAALTVVNNDVAAYSVNDNPDEGSYWYRAFYTQGQNHPANGESDCVAHVVEENGNGGLEEDCDAGPSPSAWAAHITKWNAENGADTGNKRHNKKNQTSDEENIVASIVNSDFSSHMVELDGSGVFVWPFEEAGREALANAVLAAINALPDNATTYELPDPFGGFGPSNKEILCPEPPE